MIAYIIRRLAYAVPILIGVNIITFALFFVVNTPDDMARAHLGVKRVTPDAIQKWKVQRGYNKPLLFNDNSSGAGKLTDTIFYEKSVRLFAFDFGYADDGRDIGLDIKTRMWPSLAIQLPVFLAGVLVYITLALLMAFFRATYRFLGRRAVRGDDVDLGSFLHHRRPVSCRQAVEPGADLRL